MSARSLTADTMLWCHERKRRVLAVSKRPKIGAVATTGRMLTRAMPLLPPEVVERHDAQYAGHVVGENVQRHFGGYPWQRLRHQYVRV